MGCCQGRRNRIRGIVAVLLAFLGTRVSFSSRKRPELPRMPSAPRITTFPPVPVTCDAVRSKCREMLTAALQTDRECPDVHPESWDGLSSEGPQGQPSPLVHCSRPQVGRGSWGHQSTWVLGFSAGQAGSAGQLVGWLARAASCR